VSSPRPTKLVNTTPTTRYLDISNNGINGVNGSVVHSTPPSSSGWISHQLALSLLNEIFGYLNGTDRLVRIERTCRYWPNHSKNGIGWYHLNLTEWKVPFFQQSNRPSYQWAALNGLLNKRLWSSNNVRSIRGSGTIIDWVDIINQLPRLQYAVIELYHRLQSFAGMTEALASSKLISLTIRLINTNDFVHANGHAELKSIIIPSIPSLTRLKIDWQRRQSVAMIYISSSSSLRTLDIEGNWTISPSPKNDIPIDGSNDNDASSHLYDAMITTASLPQLLLPHLVDLKTPAIPLSF
jgi:hypothetical protein